MSDFKYKEDTPKEFKEKAQEIFDKNEGSGQMT